jgi:hypothetical protein
VRYAVYSIQKCDGYANLVTAPEAHPDKVFIIFDGRPKGENWRPSPVYVLRPLDRPWDIFTIYGPSALVLTAAARIKLQAFFDRGRYELLPLVHDGKNYTVINVLEVPNCLDREHCVFRSSGSIEKYAFHPGRFTTSLFKVPEAATGNLLVAYDETRPEWSFKHQVEMHKLEGVKFKLLWEGN